MDIDEIVSAIAEATECNDHTLAILILAEYLGLPEERDRLILIENEHHRKGYLTPELGIRRNAVRKVVDAVAAERLPPNTYMRVMCAF